MTHKPMSGQSHTPSEEETMSMIRSVLTEGDASTKSTRAQRRARTTAATDTGKQPLRTGIEQTHSPDAARRAGKAQDAKTPTRPVAGKSRRFAMPYAVRSVTERVWRSSARLRAFRPSTRHVALVSVALLVVVRPHWFVIAAILTAALLIGAFLTLGSDRIWRMVVAGLARVEIRNPDRAARLRVRLDRFACRWDAILDVFPEGSVDGLYMPDLQAMQNADDAHTRAMSARLDRMAHDG